MDSNTSLNDSSLTIPQSRFLNTINTTFLHFSVVVPHKT